MSRRLQIPQGTTFGRLTTVADASPLRLPSGQSKRMMLCKCECGTETIVLLDNLRRGLTKSCGCGEIESRIKHGLSGQPLYQIWIGMHSRCRTHPNYADRGIKVHDVWHGDDGMHRFIAWAQANGHAAGLEIDRRDNDKDYEPSNCRFVTPAINQRNKRDTLCALDPASGQMVSVYSYWEENRDPSVNYETARCRLKYHGWDLVRAVTAPPYASHFGHANRRAPQ